MSDVYQGHHSLYLYCPLLRIVPVEGRDGEMMTRVFDPIQYCPLAQRRFQEIHIDIRDDAEKVVPLERGRVVVTLHCRKKNTYLERSKPIIARRKRTTIITYTKPEGDIQCTLEHVIREDTAWEVFSAVC